MKDKVLLISALMLASLLIIVIQPVEAPLSEDDYNMTKYDPQDDAMRLRQGSAFKFEPYNNVEITKITSTYDDTNPVIPKIELSMQVAGSIVSSDDKYKYAFGVLADGEEYIIGYSAGVGAGFKLGGETFVVSPTVSGNTLRIKFLLSDISDDGSLDNQYDFSGAAVYTHEDEYERYLDLAPDKLLLITEPSDQSTVDGEIYVRGVVRNSIDNKPGGKVKIKIGNGPEEDVSGGTSWSYRLDTTTLEPGEETKIEVYMDGEDLDNAKDEIWILADQNTGNYAQITKKPVVNIGDQYHYKSVGQTQIIGIPIEISNEMYTKVVGYETVNVGGTDYDAYIVHTHTEGSQDLGYVEYRNNVDRWSWKEDTNYGTVQERTISTGEVIGSPEKTVDTLTTYSPKPLETHENFEAKVGWSNKWTLDTTASSQSNTTEGSGSPTQNPDYTDQLSISGECLFYRSSFTDNDISGSYDNVYAIKTQYENPGVSVIEYYSEDLGVPVKIETYDPSRNKLFSLGLDSYTKPPTSLVIEDVTFSPSTPKVETENKIIVHIKNIGEESATDYQITVNDGDTEVAKETLPNIEAGATLDYEANWNPSSEGSHNITVVISYDGTNVASKVLSINVAPKSEDDPEIMMFVVPIIVVIIILVILLVVIMKRRGAGAPEGKAKEAEAPAEEAAAAAAPVTIATEEEPEKTPPAETEPEAEPQMMTESIQCPSCKKGFTVKYESKPIRVKCPSCGTEGVLK
ncbi:MAG: hypothetical protein JSW00_13810 [Thermoplasmata archaeon]|nr:MAG: hypothetical protein JSW00_13810 [Thermoplasmata archaeon]